MAEGMEQRQAATTNGMFPQIAHIARRTDKCRAERKTQRRFLVRLPPVAGSLPYLRPSADEGRSAKRTEIRWEGAIAKRTQFCASGLPSRPCAVGGFSEWRAPGAEGLYCGTNRNGRLGALRNEPKSG